MVNIHAPLPVDAVPRGQHPLLVDEGAAAEGAEVDVDAGLVRELLSSSDVPVVYLEMLGVSLGSAGHIPEEGFRIVLLRVRRRKQ